jgi:hypothetical protein
MNPIHIPKPYFPKIHLNVVLPSTPRSSQRSPPEKKRKNKLRAEGRCKEEGKGIKEEKNK